MQQRVVTAAADRSGEDDLDAQLIDRIRRLDWEAFQQLYDRHYWRLARFLGGLTSNAKEAEDVINDTLWFVCTQARELPEMEPVAPWITRIAYKHCLRVMSRVPHSESLRQPLNGGSESDIATGKTVEHRLFQPALAELPLKDRLLMALTYTLGHSRTEIAQILEWPVSLVEVRMLAARCRLNQAAARSATGRRRRSGWVTAGGI